MSHNVLEERVVELERVLASERHDREVERKSTTRRIQNLQAQVYATQSAHEADKHAWRKWKRWWIVKSQGLQLTPEQIKAYPVDAKPPSYDTSMFKIPLADMPTCVKPSPTPALHKTLTNDQCPNERIVLVEETQILGNSNNTQLAQAVQPRASSVSSNLANKPTFTPTGWIQTKPSTTATQSKQASSAVATFLLKSQLVQKEKPDTEPAAVPIPISSQTQLSPSSSPKERNALSLKAAISSTVIENGERYSPIRSMPQSSPKHASPTSRKFYINPAIGRPPSPPITYKPSPFKGYMTSPVLGAGSKACDSPTTAKPKGKKRKRHTEPVKANRLEETEEVYAGESVMRDLHRRRAAEVKAHGPYNGKGNYARGLTVQGEEALNKLYEIDPDKNGGVKYQYNEVVRKKEDRKRMHVGDCECCEGYYEKAVPVIEGEGEDERMARIQERKKKSCRHREQWACAESPPGYWDLAFPSTQKVEDYNRKAEEMRQAKRRKIEKELKQETSRYRRK